MNIHLHEKGESGLKTVEFLIAKVNENPVLKGCTYFSHCFILEALDSRKLEATCKTQKDAQIGYNVMPIP
ncbi:hypothetical protein [Cecembia sp.]|nr:hypothetical protein [Cecembia sp.]